MGIFVSGICLFAFSVSQGLWDVGVHIHGETDDQAEARYAVSLKKFYIRLTVSASATVMGYLLSPCTIMNKFK